LGKGTVMIDRLIADITEVRRKAAETPVAFDPVTLLVWRELDLSRVFAWMLEPDGTHDAGTAFLNLFLEMIDLPSADTARVRVIREHVLGPDGSRADILIRHPRWTVLVENKPWAKFGDRQVERYVRAIAARHGVSKVAVLLGPGAGPDEVVRLREMAGVQCLMLGEAVRDWTRRCAAIVGKPDVAAFLNHLERFLDLEFGSGEARNMRTEIEHIMQTPDTIAAAITIVDAESALADAMNLRFAEIVEERCRPHGLALRSDADLPLFGRKYPGTMRIDIGNLDYDFAIESVSAMFNDIDIGVCARKKRTTMRGRHGRVIADLERALGQSEEPNLWWPWWMRAEAAGSSGRPARSRADLWAWAADSSDAGLAATFVTQAVAARDALLGVAATADPVGED
jgi:hypothetical protein